MKDMEFVRRVLSIFNGFDGLGPEDLFWRVDGQYAPVTFFVNCNDLFWWGCADSEEVTPDNVALVEQAHEDCKRLDRELALPPGQGVYAPIYAGLLFCCRVQKMRPQGAYYCHLPEKTWRLFDDCGPVREVSPGNPKRRPGEKEAS